MVSAGVGITLLPLLAVQPPVPRSDSLRLLAFTDSRPSRQIALVWRKSAANSDFLGTVAEVLRSLPPELLEPPREGATKPRGSNLRRRKPG
jgi:LysR family hydrogen peroxide-inducible transcriptional activator